MTAQSSNRHTILLVDDNADLRLLIATTLAQSGIDVVEACDGAEAIKSLSANRVDLLITDLIMPDVEGLELIRRLRKSGFAGRILAISGGGMVVTENHLHAARHLGADRVLAKPFSLTELTKTVHQLLGADQ